MTPQKPVRALLRRSDLYVYRHGLSAPVTLPKRPRTVGNA